MRGALLFLRGGGLVYAVTTGYGILIDQHSAANFIPVNTADNWLHAFLALGLIGAGLALTPQSVDNSQAAPGMARPGPNHL